MTHPEWMDLALYPSGDLALVRRIGIWLHLVRCAGCRDRVDSYRSARKAVAGEAAILPPSLDWDDLASEMKANIRLGLTVGEIAGGEPVREPSPAWRAAVVLASVLMLASAVLWWYHRTYGPDPGAPIGGPLLLTEGVDTGSIVLRATLGGIGVESSGRALALAAEEEGAARGVTVSLQGSMNARYVDEDGDEVTIHRVYAE